MKSLIALYKIVLAEAGTRCGTSTSRDAKSVTARTNKEGMSFLTITLPRFCSEFERSLDQGYVAHDQYIGFSKSSRGGLPRLFSGFLELVFDRSSGLLLEEPNLHAIQAIRQITLMFGKIAMRCTPEREASALAKFLECEQDVRRYDSIGVSEPSGFEDFARVGRMLWAEFLSKVDSRVYNEGLHPRHGPGATADYLRGNAKYDQLMWTRRLEEDFPHWEYIIPSESFLDRTDSVTILEPGDEVPVRVTLVPKTLKTPRIIAVEPTCMQYMQQGILGTIMEEIPRFDNTRHFIMFESQQPNQRLAREGSLSGALATLDLSEASDRVSNKHVQLLLANHRALRRAVDATRSRKAYVRGTGNIDLAKFASMGSALCFPMEALVFTTIVFLGIEKALRRQLNRRDILSLYGKVRVYGDDIIVPVEYVQSVVEALESYGLKVNPEKSFWTGRFRESCGKEFYAGHNVCVARVRNLLPNNRQHVDRLVSAVSLRNQFYHLGYLDTVDHLDKWIEKIIPFPYVMWKLDPSTGEVSSTSSLLGRHGQCEEHWFSLPSQEYRHDVELQLPLVRGAWSESVTPSSILDDYGALMKFLLKQGDEPFLDRRHLQRAGRSSSAHIKTGWAPPF